MLYYRAIVTKTQHDIGTHKTKQKNVDPWNRIKKDSDINPYSSKPPVFNKDIRSTH